MGYTFDRCPNFYLKQSEFLQEAFEVFAWRGKGFLPFPGSWLDQPNIILELLTFMEQLIHFKSSAEKKMAG